MTTTLKRKVLRNGQLRYWRWSMLAARWLPIAKDDAELLIATEQAKLTK